MSKWWNILVASKVSVGGKLHRILLVRSEMEEEQLIRILLITQSRCWDWIKFIWCILPNWSLRLSRDDVAKLKISARVRGVARIKSFVWKQTNDGKSRCWILSWFKQRAAPDSTATYNRYVDSGRRYVACLLICRRSFLWCLVMLCCHSTSRCTIHTERGLVNATFSPARHQGKVAHLLLHDWKRLLPDLNSLHVPVACFPLVCG